MNDTDISIIIDNREHKIISLLNDDKFKTKNPDFKYTTENLDIGDFKFSINNNHFIVERKTVDDLVSSIKDGRYKEQKCRLINEIKNNTKIIYLIEGDIWKCKRFNSDALFSVIINSMIRDNIYVYISKDILHTILFIEKICKQLIKNRDSLNNTETNTEYSQYIKSNKKANVTEYTCFINQLAQIPGVSNSIGKVIAEKYKTLYNFINCLIKDENEYNNISELRYGKSNRRIGKKLTEHIKFFIGIDNYKSYS